GRQCVRQRRRIPAGRGSAPQGGGAFWGNRHQGENRGEKGDRKGRPYNRPPHTNDVIATQCRGDPCGRPFATSFDHLR
ncbi:MAG: hypothetical protein LBQ76_05565, partial [Candidatus Fibromonas sp.]|nr:hypothetical protein [Candidatus Fibromonas sp.]